VLHVERVEQLLVDDERVVVGAAWREEEGHAGGDVPLDRLAGRDAVAVLEVEDAPVLQHNLHVVVLLGSYPRARVRGEDLLHVEAEPGRCEEAGGV